MTIELFLKGLFIGGSIAMAVGPIGLLCISRTLEKGFWAGMAIGLGAATADGIYGAIAGLGLTFITDFLTSYETIIRIFGGLYLLYLGIKTLSSKKNFKKATLKDVSFLKSYIGTTFLTLTSPMTILFFITIFASISLETGVTNTTTSSLTLILGVLFGSIFYHMFLVFSVSKLKEKLKSYHLTIITKLSGILISGFALKIIILAII